LVTILYYSRE